MQFIRATLFVLIQLFLVYNEKHKESIHKYATTNSKSRFVRVTIVGSARGLILLHQLRGCS